MDILAYLCVGLVVITFILEKILRILALARQIFTIFQREKDGLSRSKK